MATLSIQFHCPRPADSDFRDSLELRASKSSSRLASDRGNATDVDPSNPTFGGNCALCRTFDHELFKPTATPGPSHQAQLALRFLDSGSFAKFAYSCQSL